MSLPYQLSKFCQKYSPEPPKEPKLVIASLNNSCCFADKCLVTVQEPPAVFYSCGEWFGQQIH